MKNWKMSLLLWVLAVLSAVAVMIFQRMTGPTHPVMAREMVEGKGVAYRFLRSSTALEPMRVAVRAADESVKGVLYSRRYDGVNSYDYRRSMMTREGQRLVGFVPGEDTAGKVEYIVKVIIGDSEKEIPLNDGEPIVARFKGAVPSAFLISHIIFMVFGFIFAIRTAFEALRKEGNFYWLVNWTLGIVLIGGMILGPIVQYYAFGDLWTGIPFGTDLTDNKTLIAFIFWVLAFFFKKKSKWWVIAAAVVMIIIYSIPHSVLGSERNYKTGEMKNKYSSVHVQLPSEYKKTVKIRS